MSLKVNMNPLFATVFMAFAVSSSIAGKIILNRDSIRNSHFVCPFEIASLQAVQLTQSILAKFDQIGCTKIESKDRDSCFLVRTKLSSEFEFPA